MNLLRVLTAVVLIVAACAGSPPTVTEPVPPSSPLDTLTPPPTAVAASPPMAPPTAVVASPAVVASLSTSPDSASGGSAERLKAYPAGETSAPLSYYEYLPPGYGDGDPRPLLFFVHGKDECGDGSLGQLYRLLSTGVPALIQNNDWAGDRPFVVLAPQHDCPRQDQHYDQCGEGQHYGSCMLELQHRLGHPVDGSLCMTPTELYEFISYAVPAYDVDPQRVYLTGLSCGAYTAFEYAAEHGATQIAAMVPIAGEGRPAWEASGCELGEVAIWAFHGSADYEVDPAGTTEPMNNLLDCPQPPRQDVELTVYPGVDHDSWTRTYDLSAGHDPYEWLLRFALPPTSHQTCPSVHGGGCLGPLEAGTYTTRWFKTPLTYTLPDGWANYEDLPGNFLLIPPSGSNEGVDAGTSDYIGVYNGVAPASGDCQERAEPGLALTPEAMGAWYASHPGLTVEGPERVTIGGLDGVVLDLAMAEGEAGVCRFPDFDGRLVPILIGAGPAELAHALIEGLVIRLYLLAAPTGEVIAIEIDDLPGGDTMESMTQVVEDMEFGIAAQ